jgi:quercetin dioxygenase-like cupin family protein
VGTLMGEEPKESFIILRKEEMSKHPHLVSKESLGYGYSYVTLGQEKKDRRMEPFLVTLEPGTTESEKVSVHEGEEFLYVLEGELEVDLDQNKEVLLPGDSIYYDGSIPHFLKCHGDIPTKIVAVIYVPEKVKEMERGNQ